MEYITKINPCFIYETYFYVSFYGHKDIGKETRKFH